MKMALLVLGAPCSSQASLTALRFAHAALSSGHQIYSVFFYQDGVYCALNETGLGNSAESWQKLQSDHRFDLSICVGATQKRGLTLPEDGRPPQINGFALSGLGQLADATLQADRLLTFGA